MSAKSTNRLLLNTNNHVSVSDINHTVLSTEASNPNTIQVAPNPNADIGLDNMNNDQSQPSNTDSNPNPTNNMVVSEFNSNTEPNPNIEQQPQPRTFSYNQFQANNNNFNNYNNNANHLALQRLKQEYTPAQPNGERPDNGCVWHRSIEYCPESE